jgi:subtilase family serine protease
MFLVAALPAGAAGWAAGPDASATRAIGTAPTVPAAAQLLRPLGGSTPVQLAVSLVSKDQAGLQDLATAVATPDSPEFRHFLTLAEAAARFGAPAASLAAVRAWLAGTGLQVAADHG